ncbi:hypothetical protein OAN24_04070 [Pseudodesulfovibrio sp.]|nr:hypothetical protein [Pseudodesulfovibrio sp.]
MSIKFILAQATPTNYFWHESADILVKDHGWEMQYVVGPASLEQWVRENHPNAVFHDKGLAKFSRPAPGVDLPPYPLDKRIMDILAPYEERYLEIVGRYLVKTTDSYALRKQAYLKGVAYWASVLHHFQPDVVLTRVLPHMGYDFLLHFIARAMGIKVVSYDRVFTLGRSIPVRSYEDGPELARNDYEKGVAEGKHQGAAIDADLAQVLEDVRSDYETGMPDYVKFFHRQKLRPYMPETYYIWKTLVRLGKGLSWPPYKLFKFRNILNSQYHNWRKKRAYKFLQSNGTLPQKGEKYIYVGLQCEPEAPVNPGAGIYSDQTLMIRLLSQSIPADWTIYVKDHPHQLYHYRPFPARPKGFYDSLLALGNVRLLPNDTNSFAMIDGSMAAANIGCSISLESIIRGKPCLLFGQGWNMYCEGTFVCRDKEDVLEAIRSIELGFEVDQRKVDYYMQTILEHTVESFTSDDWTTTGHPAPNKENARELARGVMELYERYDELPAIPAPLAGRKLDRS